MIDIQDLLELGRISSKNAKAIRTLGGLLCSKTDENNWVRVRDSEICQLEQKKDAIMLV